jgi:hypothetical protein
MVSAVDVPATDRLPVTSAVSDLTCLAASAEALTRVFCASRAPAVMASAVDLPEIDRAPAT